MYRLPRFRTLATLAVAAAAVMTAPAAQAAMVDHDTLSQGSGSFQFQSGDLFLAPRQRQLQHAPHRRDPS